jgi:HPt (histidine-containing phosphotransfer) domain-containing protein
MNLPEDPFVRELLPEFVDTWIQDLDDQVNPIFESKNSQDLYRVGHTLKGSCFQFGLDEIANQGIELMGYSKEEAWDKAALLIDNIKKTLTNIKAELDKMGEL